jgi:outer membrane murein-binding lipoprotein Lpp
MTVTAQELLDMKQKIDSAKTEANRIEGQIAQIEKQRTEEFGCNTDAEAEEYIQELTEQVDQLEKDLESGVKAIRDELNW